MRTSLQKSRYFLTFLLALLVLCLSSCSKKAEDQPNAAVARPIKMMTVGDVSSSSNSNGSAQTRKLPGTVKAADQVDLAFQVSGTLIDLPVKEGQRVKKGDLVARLDTRDFISNLNNAKGVVAKANAEYQRYRNIKATDAGAVSDSMVSLKQSLLKVSKANLQSAQTSLAITQDQLNYTSLRVPFSGIVARKYVDNFQELKAKQAVC